MEQAEPAPHRLLLPGPALHALQQAIWPAHPHPRHDLCVHISGDAEAGPEGLRLSAGATVTLDTAFNIFPLAKWRDRAGLTDLRLILRGQGRFILTVSGEVARRKPPIRLDQTLTLTAGEPQEIDLSDWIAGKAEILHLAFRAQGAVRIERVTWASRNPPRRLPRLALSITTFHREYQAQRSIARFALSVDTSPLAPWLSLTVVDNGRTLPPSDQPRVRVLPNPNLGGSGGFARGMIEARAAGATHCLFMDDDAALDFASIERIWTFLAHATDPRTAVAGALMSAEFPTQLWENGASFNGKFRAFSRCDDLATPAELFKAEFLSLRKVKNFYGGFWAYAFPLEHATHAPFPFFVRGDDTSFCIANGFANVTLPGVLSHQEVDFTEKESSLTLYLDLRSNLIHLATLPQRLRLPRALLLASRFFARSLMQHQIDSLRGLNLAVEDFLAGPGPIAAEPDLASRRAGIAADRSREVWRPLTGPLPEARIRIDPNRRLVRLVFFLLLNGMLAPGFARWGNRVILSQKQRGIVRPVWGAAELIYVSTDGGSFMHLRLDRKAALREAVRMLRNLGRLVWRFPRLRHDWQKGYAEMTRPDWWRAQFDKG